MGRIEKIQERALRMVYGDKSTDYMDLLKRAKIPSLETKWKRNLVLEVYKAVHNLAPIYIQDLFREKKVPYSFKASKILVQPKCKSTKKGLRSLTYEGSALWNKLPNHIKDAKDVNTFKSLLAKHEGYKY